MADSLFGSIGKALKGLKDKTQETVARQQAALANGKIAGSTVLDDNGNVLVDAGHRIDDEVLARAEAAGKLAAVASSALQGQAQDYREKVSGFVDSTEEGRENRALDSVEEFVEARRYLGRYAGLDVTDIRGNVIVALGTQIDDQVVRDCREKGALGPLIAAAQTPYTPPPAPATAPLDLRSEGPSAPLPTPKRATLPLMDVPTKNND